jgi:hypothetical protein
MNSARAQATARRMIGALNLTIVLQPTVPKGTAAATPISVRAGSFSARTNDDRFSSDAKVRERQRLLYLAATDVAGVVFADPKADDIIQQLEGATPWRVLGNSPLRVDGVTPILHELVIQR